MDVGDQSCYPAPLPTGKELLALQRTGDWVDPQPACMFQRRERSYAAAKNETQDCPASLITESTETNCLYTVN